MLETVESNSCEEAVGEEGWALKAGRLFDLCV